MLMNVFSSTSGNTEDKIDTSLIVQKPYLSTNYIENIIELHIDIKNQKSNKKIRDPKNMRDKTSKIYVDNLFNDPSAKRNTDYVEFINHNLDNVRFARIEQH